MVDQWVIHSQNWVNAQYANVPGYVAVEVTGVTGWKTMYALTRALQWELGITTLSDSFGPTTFSRLSTQYPNISATTTNRNVRAIVQCALWCKGYQGGNYTSVFGDWDSTTSGSIAIVRSDLGLAAASTVSPKLLKSLLTMDAYTVVGSGSAVIRTIQQDFNKRYSARRDFYLIPCDGRFSRDVQTGLMYAIQYEQGLVDGVANGNFGPTTQSGLRSGPAVVAQGAVDSSTYWVHIFQAAMIFNGYSSGPYDGKFTSVLASSVRVFQTFAALTVTAKADFATWASLLVSTGDPERPARAADCITTILPKFATTLYTAGYRTIGRYLTNTPNIDDATDKNIKAGELSTIFGAGMTVFPIFQEGGTGVDFFSGARGLAAGYRAHAAAMSYGFKAGTVIYFAVDFDALEEEVYSNVVPHFKKIAEAFAAVNSSYRIGVYGARNTCRIVSDAKLAVYSFVSGMSTGYSGNLGYPLPKNWSFDQIKEYVEGSDPLSQINIDKDMMSGRDAGQSSVSIVAQNAAAFTYIDKLHTLAVEYLAKAAAGEYPSTTTPPRVLVIQNLRQDDYNDLNPLWPLVAGSVDVYFRNYVLANPPSPTLTAFIDPSTNNGVDFSHLAVAANGLTQNAPLAASSAIVGLPDMAGWAGDLVQTVIAYDIAGNSGDAYAFAKNYIGSTDPTLTFPWEDLIQDVDGYNIGVLLRASPTATFGSIFRSYYGTSTTAGWRTRWSKFRTNRLSTNHTVAVNTAIAAITQASDVGYAACRAALYADRLRSEFTVSVENKIKIATAFVDLIEAKALS